VDEWIDGRHGQVVDWALDPSYSGLDPGGLVQIIMGWSCTVNNFRLG
jgi:hypothetical protein